MNNSWSSNKKTILGLLSFLILTPLLIYTNCGNVQDGMQSQLDAADAESKTHQKIFIDIAGENLDDETDALKSGEGESKLMPPPEQACSEWIQEAYIKASNANVNDFFAESVSISGDRMVVGSRLEDAKHTTIINGATSSSDNSSIDSGAAYVYARLNGVWKQEAYLKPSNSNPNDQFGSAVAISNNRIVVAASFEDSNQLTITNGPTASFNNTLSNSGAAYVFARVNNTWIQEAFLKAPNAEANDMIGSSVAIYGNRILVSTMSEDSNQTTITNGPTASSNNSMSSSGAVYVFARVNNVWIQEAYLKASNANANDWFGTKVSISGDRIVVGASIEDSNQTSISNGAIASTNNSFNASGAAYVFVRSGGLWVQEAYLKASNANPISQFGVAVAISGDQIVVGASAEQSCSTGIINGSNASSNTSCSDAGAAYIFSRSSGQWQQTAYLKPAYAPNMDSFGRSVSISENRVVVGSHDSSNQNFITNGSNVGANYSMYNSGSAYVFAKVNNQWIQNAYLKPTNINEGDEFGFSVSVSGSRIAVGAFGEDSTQTTVSNGGTASANNANMDSGAAYVFACKDEI